MIDSSIINEVMHSINDDKRVQQFFNTANAEEIKHVMTEITKSFTCMYISQGVSTDDAQQIKGMVDMINMFATMAATAHNTKVVSKIPKNK